MKHRADAFAPVRQATVIPIWLTTLTTLLSVAISLISYRYLGPTDEIPSQIQTNAFLHPWLAVHAAGAATALLLGPFQFFPKLRARYLRLHGWSGRVYVLGCTAGGMSGFLLAMGASTGPVTMAGFGLLAVIWLVTTSLAWLRAVQRRIAAHKAWMIRSFALTLAAVTLRLYLLTADSLALPEVSSYQLIAFLCWVPNLVLAELYLHRLK
jgi:hypothetical protein